MAALIPQKMFDEQLAAMDIENFAQARIFQQGVQLDKFGMDEDLLHFITPLSRF